MRRALTTAAVHAPEAWAIRMPKVELHRHLEGAVRLDTVREEGIRHGVFPASITLKELQPRIQTTTQFEDLASLLAMFDNTQAVFADSSVFERIAYEAVIDAHTEGIKVLELRYAPSFCSMNFGHDFGDVLAAVQTGIERGVEELHRDISVGLLCIGVGAMGMEEMAKTIDFALSTQGRDGFIGFDMAGTEDPQQFKDYAPLFARVKDAGLKITCHASEDHTFGLPGNAIAAVDVLGADRVGHGIQIVKSEEAMNEIRDRGVMLEVSVFEIKRKTLIHLYVAFIDSCHTNLRRRKCRQS